MTQTLALLTAPGWPLVLICLAALALLGEAASRRIRARGGWAPPGVAAGLIVVAGGVLGCLGAVMAGMPVTQPGGISVFRGLAAAGAVTLLWLVRGTAAMRPLAAVVIVGLVTGGPAMLAPPPGDAASLDGLVLTDLGGRPVALDDRQGRPLVLNLWASWCGPCRAEMPMMQRVAADRPEVDIVFANQAETPVTVGTYLATEGLSAAGIVLDPDRRTARRYGGIGLPTTVFFSADGRMQSVYVGEIPKAALLERIEMILAPAP